jgi:DNA ligase-1
MKEFPTLFAKSKLGKIKQWNIKAQARKDNTAEIVTIHGFKDGKKQTATIHIAKGKNIGRKNATSPYQQALKEATAKWAKKRKEGYKKDLSLVMASNNNTDLKGRPKPMLAHKFSEKKVKFPCYMQPKLDGVRCLAYQGIDGIHLISREGTKYDTLKHLKLQLTGFGGFTGFLDGEIYAHGVPFQQFTKWLKTEQVETLQLEYHVYDSFNSLGDSFGTRLFNTQQRIKRLDAPQIKMVETVTANNMNDIQEYFSNCIAKGYEGIMIRNIDGKYEAGFRSQNLLKYKEFDDDEFEIVGGYEGKGKYKGCVTFECKTDEGVVFGACPKGTIAEKREYWDNLEDYIGKMLTVRYFGYTDAGRPRFPVGIVIRDYE